MATWTRPLFLAGPLALISFTLVDYLHSGHNIWKHRQKHYKQLTDITGYAKRYYVIHSIHPAKLQEAAILQPGLRICGFSQTIGASDVPWINLHL